MQAHGWRRLLLALVMAGTLLALPAGAAVHAGKIIAGGSGGNKDFAVARYLPAGPRTYLPLVRR